MLTAHLRPVLPGDRSARRRLTELNNPAIPGQPGRRAAQPAAAPTGGLALARGVDRGRSYSGAKMTMVVLPVSGIEPPLLPEATATYCFPFCS